MNPWEEVKERINVHELIAEYVPISGAGDNYRCICPFHREKTPSLIISPAKKIWHCFGCGQGGDIFSFVSEIENITRGEALVRLAKKAGVTLERRADNEHGLSQQQSTTSEFENGLKYLEWAAKLFHQVLLKILTNRSHPVTLYCLERQLTPDIITKFNIGYAPGSQWLNAFAHKQSISIDILTQTGLLKTVEDQPGLLKDKFSDRLMIPVMNQQGAVVGFTGRVLPYDTSGRPKYLNSSETKWFKKGEIWFGWHLARPSIIQEKAAIVVEGNMDVIAAFSYGLTNTIASQGTSFTVSQLKLLKTLTRTIIIAFDNDVAGLVTAQKLYKEATKLGFTVQRLAYEMEYKDIDDWLKNSFEIGSKVSKDALKIMNFLDFELIHSSAELTSTDVQVQKKAITEFLDLLSVQDDLSIEQYVIRISEITKISKETLTTILTEKRSQITITEPEEISNVGYTPRKLDAHQYMWITLQTLFAWYYAGRLPGVVSADVIADLYNLMRNSLTSLKEHETFEAFASRNREELELINSQFSGTLEIEVVQGTWRSLIHYIDSIIQSFLLSKELKEAYIRVKNIQV